MYTSMTEPDGGDYIGGTDCDGVLDRAGKTRWRDVEGLLEKRPVQGIRFVEQGQHAKLAVREKSFQGDLCPGDELLNEDLARGAVGGERDVGPLQDSHYAPESGHELRRVVSADDATTGGQRQRFHDARIIDPTRHLTWVLVDGKSLETGAAEA